MDLSTGIGRALRAAAALVIALAGAAALPARADTPIVVPWGFTTQSTGLDDKTFAFSYLGGAAFTFQSIALAETTFDFDVFGCSPPGPFSLGSPVGVTGSLGGATVFTTTARALCPAGSFTTFVNPFGDLVVDALSFTVPGLSAVQAKDLTITPVPEPSTWALMAAGLLAAGLAARRRRRAA